MTHPPGQPPHGSDPYGQPSYGHDPYSQPEFVSDPFGQQQPPPAQYDPTQTGAQPVGPPIGAPTGEWAAQTGPQTGPQAGPQTGGFPAQPQPPSDQSASATKWFLIGGGVLVLALMLWAGAYLTYTRLATDSPTEVTQQFIEAIQRSDGPAALDVVCAAERGRGSVDELTEDAEDIVEWTVTSESTGNQSAEVRTLLTYRDGERVRSATMVVTLIKEDGDWRICNVRQVR